MDMTPEWHRGPASALRATVLGQDDKRHGGRDAAVTALYQEHWIGLVRLAVIMVGDRASAEDAVQDAFAQLHRSWHRIKDPARAATYLRSTVLNRCRSILRRRKVAARHGTHHAVAMWSPESDAVVGEEHREVLQALQRLPKRLRQALVLRYYADLSDAEIGATLGVRQGTVRSAVSRGLVALRRILEESS